jgi:NAD(P)-dependent dehydrogenase (short-subunit alcohol dehydrogenase family)
VGKLDVKVAVVTGANSGMGFATAKKFAEEGAKVIITGRRQKELDEAVKSIGKNIEGVQGDITKSSDLTRLHDHIKSKYGRVDIIFANAGGGALGPFGSVTEEQFDVTSNINFKGTFFTVQTLLPLVPDGGSIILNASTAASSGLPGFTVYSATKAAVRSFARTWTQDLKARKIRVNALSPGHIETPIMEKAGIPKETVKQIWDQDAATVIPAGRIGQPEEVAAAALFLASSDSSFVTGAELFVDGGQYQV